MQTGLGSLPLSGSLVVSGIPEGGEQQNQYRNPGELGLQPKAVQDGATKVTRKLVLLLSVAVVRYLQRF
jgi:hypothetical protein